MTHILDQLVADEQRRVEAAQVLSEIAEQFPDLFGRAARAFLDSTPEERSIADPVEVPTAPRLTRVCHVLQNSDHPLTMKEIGEIGRMTRSQVRHIIETVAPQRFVSEPDPNDNRTRRWSLATTAEDSQKPKLMGPTEAIRAWLRMHSEGGTAGEIAEGIKAVVESSSIDFKNTVHGTLGSLERRGRVSSSVDDHGRKVYRLNG